MIYIVEDDEDYREELREYLEKSGFSTSWGESIQYLDALVRDQNGLHPGDIVLLDLTLGVSSAFEFIQRISTTPAACIVLTGSVGESEKIIGLELGADDYISKTSSPREIVARIKSIIRRFGKSGDGNATAIPAQNHGWIVDKARLAVRDPSGAELGLTVTEFKLLGCLVDAAGEAVSREKLVKLILRKPYDPTDRSIDNLVSRIRNKFRQKVGDVEIIKSARHLGYIFLGFPRVDADSHSGIETG